MCNSSYICYPFCPGRITPVFEHKTSIVTLHCEIEKPTDPLIEVRVIWLFSDTILEPSEFVEIIKPVSLHYFHFKFPTVGTHIRQRLLYMQILQ